MPELPEVETVVRVLRREVVGRRLVHVAVHERRLRRRLAPDFASRLAHRRVERIDRRGKYLVAWLDDAQVWLVHLGMSGRLVVGAPPVSRGRHDHVVIRLDDGRALVYTDARRFGWMTVVPPASLPQAAGDGLDPLAGDFTPASMHALTRGRRTPIKALLMDQRRIAGLGNIYANEILFRAGVRPGRRAARLGRTECARIVEAARKVLAEAIRGGGSSIADYRDGLGRAGRFQRRHAVYGRGDEPCRVCGTPIRRRIVCGRSSFYCGRCQR